MKLGSCVEVGVPIMKLGLPQVDWAYELCVSQVSLWDVLVLEAVFLKADHFSWLLGPAARFY